jgi:hypothetical protein
MQDNDFVGAEEVLRMEHGAAYGMSRIQYWRLASCALACEKYAEIHPSTISALVHEPGCLLELFGKRCLFTITVRPRLHQISLGVFPLNSAQEKAVEAFSGSDSQEDFMRLTNVILQTDGLVGWKFMSYEETLAFLQNQAIDC